MFVCVGVDMMCVLAFLGNCHQSQVFIGCVDLQECVLQM